MTEYLFIGGIMDGKKRTVNNTAAFVVGDVYYRSRVLTCSTSVVTVMVLDKMKGEEVLQKLIANYRSYQLKS